MWSTVPHCAFFNSYVCHVCKTFDKPLKRCSSCKTISYCSTEHQRFDWKIHKELCCIMKQLTCLDLSVRTFKDLLGSQYQKYMYWKDCLKRELYDYEMQIWMFPRYCVVCYSKDANIICKECHNISYCSEEHKVFHKSQHENHCPELKLSLEIDVSLFEAGFEDYSLDVIPEDILDDIDVLPANLEQLMCIYDKNYESVDDKVHVKIGKSDLIAPVATILYGLEVSSFSKNRVFPKEELVVHLVGADLTEMGWLWKLMSELPFHWIKNLRKLEYFIIGPDLNHSGTTDKFTHQLCGSCKRKNSTTSITFLEQLYHNVVDVLKKPDVVVALNSGLHEFSNDPKDTWKESIPFLCKNSRVPLILTAYTIEEIIADINLVVSADEKVKVLVEPHKNPFSNMKPLKNFNSETDPIYFINGYVTVLLRN